MEIAKDSLKLEGNPLGGLAEMVELPTNLCERHTLIEQTKRPEGEPPTVKSICSAGMPEEPY